MDKCVQGFKKLRELIPYLREARRRWAQAGRRVPVPGRPCWTEWITQNLHVTPRRVQQLLNEPSEIHSQGEKSPRRLGTGDWRGLFKLTEKQMAKVSDRSKPATALRRRFCNSPKPWQTASESATGALKCRLQSWIGASGTIARILVAPLWQENPAISRRTAALRRCQSSTLRHPPNRIAAAAAKCTLGSPSSSPRTAAPTRRQRKPAASA